MREDTIAAIATAPGEGAIGVVRISGPGATGIAKRIGLGSLRDRRARFAHFRDPASGAALDEGIALLMRGPRSYTGEDVVELQGHGGSRVLRRLFEATLCAGARAAEPGEFTLRAFLNGRLDLAQAEAVLALVQARTDVAADLALAGLQGKLTGPLRAARTAALELLAYLSARADFPDEDVPLRDIGPELAALGDRLERLAAEAEYGLLQREGASIAIVGRPNAGKSSLLNRLLRQDRAIVTPVPGTTRDTLEETANLGGLRVVLTDTAGIRETTDAVERLGVERSRAAAAASDLLLLVIDASTPLNDDDRSLLALAASAPSIAALNKLDLGALVAPGAPELDGICALPVSALTGEGLDALERELHRAIIGERRPPASGAALSTLRQRDAARRALTSVRAACEGFAAGAPEDLLSVDLAAAVRALGELTGEDATEDLLDTIFTRFCIGK
ncbi:MAG TPA: tRNA uridine-5-carboxymethylaminomethyl(34) synthesis GTPase MnmE [Dehalococcoidia bacterium]|nr:tRNA uridine-5-carboxymethylaminomethyl(34) synthesis GTPase MnmE [Dehalococcoidia bacterium]